MLWKNPQQISIKGLGRYCIRVSMPGETLKKTLLFVIVFSLVVGAVFLSGCLQQEGSGSVVLAQPGPVKLRIGALLDLTGKGASYGNDARDAALLAVEDLRKTQKSLEVELLFEDSQSEDLQAVNSAKKLLEKAGEVINIDHHVGAEEKLRALDAQYENFTYVFNNNRSGASLAWEYFYGRKTIPELVLLVEDGDIGKFEFPDKTKWSGGVLMPLMNQPAKVLELFEKPIQTILSEGKVTTDFMDFLIEMYCARNEPISLRIGEHTVVAYNANFNVERMRSTLGHILVEKHHATVALFRISRDEVAFSFRGLDAVEPSALALASMLGGNGHLNGLENSVAARMANLPALRMRPFLNPGPLAASPLIGFVATPPDGDARGDLYHGGLLLSPGLRR